MTAAAVPARSRSARARSGADGSARAGRLPGLLPARLLRLELHRSTMLWIVPLVAMLFWFDTYRSTMTFTATPLWSVRTFFLQKGNAVEGFAPFVAGVAAWTGSRDGRRRTTDLVTAAVCPRWAAQLATWAAASCWAIAAYLGCVGVLYGVTARQAAWGGPPLWPVAVGAAAVMAFSALGFAAAALTATGLVAAGTAAGLAGTARLEVTGWVIPVGDVSLPGEFSATTASFIGGIRLQAVPVIVAAVIGGRAGHPGNPAQQAVAVALAKTSGVPQLGPADGHQRPRGTPAPQVRAAALRFAALPAAARHAWLAAHLAALRAGHVTLRTLP